MLSPVIAILDDEPDRVAAMLPLLARQLPAYETVVFENAPDMIAWLTGNLHRVCLLSLDHDLGPNQSRDGKIFDPGTGRDVADFLASRTTQCHVILHTTNHLAAPGMRLALEQADWTVSQVVPYGDLAWVGEAWIDEVCSALKPFEAGPD